MLLNRQRGIWKGVGVLELHLNYEMKSFGKVFKSLSMGREKFVSLERCRGIIINRLHLVICYRGSIQKLANEKF